MIQALFVVIAAVGLLAALGTVLVRNLVHAALLLIAFFFIVACLFVMLDAEFLAAIQVLVYIGAVSILMMFAIMLTRNVQGDDTTTPTPGVIWPALAATLGLFFVLVFGVNDYVGIPRRGTRTAHRAWTSLIRRPPAEVGSAGADAAGRALVINDMGRAVGGDLVTRYAVAFEAAGLLLTAALVGAVALAHRDREDEEFDRRAARAARAAGPGPNGPGDGHANGTPVADAEPAAVGH